MDLGGYVNGLEIWCVRVSQQIPLVGEIRDLVESTQGCTANLDEAKIEHGVYCIQDLQCFLQPPLYTVQLHI